MPTDQGGHTACVQVWLERADGLDTAQLAGRFESALGGLWRRAVQTLGEITLTAIVDRVLYTAAERYPLLLPLKIESSQLRFEEFRQQDWTHRGGELREAVRFMLVEFLTVLGNLTAEILTPALHAELCSTPPSELTPEMETRRLRHEREEAKS